jgi:cysteine desulfurase
MGKAAELVKNKLPEYEKKVSPLRDALENGILSSFPNTELNGHRVKRLANTTNITFHGIESEALLILLDQEGICASNGSACLADSDEPSHVIVAMRPDTIVPRQNIRFSLDISNTFGEIEISLRALNTALLKLRSQEYVYK